MKVSIVREGGFAGIVKTTTADSTSLLPEAASTLKAKVQESGIFDLPEKLGGPTKGADRFSYSVIVEDDGGRRCKVDVQEEHLPQELKSLIEWVQKAPGAEDKIGPPGTAPPE